MTQYQPPIVMAEEYWKSSHFSIARLYGSVKINGQVYIVCDKHGTDIYTLSEIAEKEGRDNAIEPGEPCDLVLADWLPVYRAVGRDRFFEIAKATTDLDKAKEMAGIKPNRPKPKQPKHNKQ